MNLYYQYKTAHGLETIPEDVPCPVCGEPPPAPLPTWAVPGAVFALDGKTYRIVAQGSSNRGTSENYHFREMVTIEERRELPWTLPESGSAVPDVARALQSLRKLPCVFVADLARALPVAP